ncbi:tRNA (guanosine(18)-2'-O)-methyltransferase TrmH [Alteromonas halophila]|uniref:tRNA (guanosine(18)-2'-O)-methyltransferase n=1 Tax=Alteromonas halophila TaxID=516698 RepID=A0A918JK07_9ALTE|nr:tRNA (guanosine(18)-2'-O)-methyltransferase TrmH [Alteromonas halophila]GGW84566.1 tRNA (guanosine(18)-2'-O)-methyltransferase [Alteromonas halophila]
MSPERHQRIREVLRQRQLDLTVCLENVHKPHNVSAIVRTCDAIGIHRVHTVWDERHKLRGGTAMGSQQWVRTTNHDTIGEAAAALKAQDMQILVTNLSQTAVDFRDVDYTRPTAILFGQERYGVSNEAVALADQDIVIPMVGMVQSLNVSVAAALILYEAQRQRQIAGLYDKATLPDEECQQLLFEAGYPRLQKMCKRKGIAYPPIDDHGHIVASKAWWQQLQVSPAVLQALHADEIAG